MRAIDVRDQLAKIVRDRLKMDPEVRSVDYDMYQFSTGELVLGREMCNGPMDSE